MKIYTNPQFSGKPFRRLEVGETKQEGDYLTWADILNWKPCVTTIGDTVNETEACFSFYREIPADEQPDPSALMLARIEEVITKLDAVLAKLKE